MSADAATPATSTTTQSSPAVAPVDLRHVTSNSALVVDPRRTSQHLQASVRKGSRSPTSIPSSPTSVHSSSSAIFERDIEPVHLSPSALATKKDPHRIPRAKNTESIEQSVPSVLDSAASILASIDADDTDSIAVIAPAPLPSTGLDQSNTVRSRSSGFASPIGFRSRSPSPSPRPAGAKRNSLLLNLPPVITPPGSASPSTSTIPLTATSRQFADATTPTSNKRLSFISYTDLLVSTPTATQPLSALTSPASSPSHIPSVAVSDSGSITGAGSASAYGGTSGAPSLRNFGFGIGAAEDDNLMNDVGGEWEREGLGKGARGAAGGAPERRDGISASIYSFSPSFCSLLWTFPMRFLLALL
ncbi:hypothetical protein MKEN_00742600 [Mycena kentingensis (nom. inval.)]|nr:hypothetical protein MKEN_00742600 [Mycena kentingensis (nom. inval.)]